MQAQSSSSSSLTSTIFRTIDGFSLSQKRTVFSILKNRSEEDGDDVVSVGDAFLPSLGICFAEYSVAEIALK